MKIISGHEEDFLVVELTREELLILNNALNEVCNGVALVGFESRIGASRTEAEALLGLLGKVINSESKE